MIRRDVLETGVAGLALGLTRFPFGWTPQSDCQSETMNKLIAVIDDEPVIRLSFSQVFRMGGYLSDQFMDGQDFLHRIHSDLDAAVLGITNPRFNGIVHRGIR
jgi:hypothetical protein